jgi:hypothetical protein
MFCFDDSPAEIPRLCCPCLREFDTFWYTDACLFPEGAFLPDLSLPKDAHNERKRGHTVFAELKFLWKVYKKRSVSNVRVQLPVQVCAHRTLWFGQKLHAFAVCFQAMEPDP